MNITELSDLMRNNGIIGAGGAGFPSYAKLNTKADTIVLNCAECEPMLRLHRQLLARRPHEILTALSEVVKAVGAKQAVVAVKSSYTATIDAVKAELDNFENIKMKLLPRVYPAGDEIIAIYEATGRRVEAGQLPISVGVIVYNVETMFNIYQAIQNNHGVISKYVTVAGEVNNSVTVKVPLGITLKEVVALAGGPSISDYRVLVGGPMTGHMDKEDSLVTKNTNAVILLPSDHYVVNRKDAKVSISLKRAMSACCQCHYCTDMCPRHLIGYPIDPAALMRAVSTDCTANPVPYINSYYCSGCNLCEMFSCFQGLSPKSIIAEVRGELKKNGVIPPKPEMRDIDPMRDGKRVSTQRIIARLGISKYEVDAPYTEEKYSFKKVRLPLLQGIGAPAEPCVKVGDTVERGQLIANPRKNALSVALHASIAGTVTEISQRYIVIEDKEGQR